MSKSGDRQRRNQRMFEELYQGSYQNDPLFGSMMGQLHGQLDGDLFNEEEIRAEGMESIQGMSNRYGREMHAGLSQQGLGSPTQKRFLDTLLGRTRNTQIQAMNALIEAQSLYNKPADQLGRSAAYGQAAVFSQATKYGGY